MASMDATPSSDEQPPAASPQASPSPADQQAPPHHSQAHEIGPLMREVAEELGRPVLADQWITKLEENYYDTMQSLRDITREEWNGSICLPGRIFDLMKRKLGQSQISCSSAPSLDQATSSTSASPPPITPLPPLHATIATLESFESSGTPSNNSPYYTLRSYTAQQRAGRAATAADSNGTSGSSSPGTSRPTKPSLNKTTGSPSSASSSSSSASSPSSIASQQSLLLSPRSRERDNRFKPMPAPPVRAATFSTLPPYKQTSSSSSSPSPQQQSQQQSQPQQRKPPPPQQQQSQQQSQQQQQKPSMSRQPIKRASPHQPSAASSCTTTTGGQSIGNGTQSSLSPSSSSSSLQVKSRSGTKSPSPVPMSVVVLRGRTGSSVPNSLDSIQRSPDIGTIKTSPVSQSSGSLLQTTAPSSPRTAGTTTTTATMVSGTRATDSTPSTAITVSTPVEPKLISQGYLNKKGNNLKGYNRRWFVIKEGVLYYYKKQRDAEMVEKDTLGAIDLILYQIRQQGTHFLLISMERTYEFETESEEECARWVFSIQKQIKSVRKELMRKSTGGAQRLALAPAQTRQNMAVLDNVVKQGYIKIRVEGGLFSRAWQPRFVSLKNEFLMVFKGQSAEDLASPVAEINVLFGFARVKEPCHGRKFVFEYVAADRTYLFSCETSEENDEWVTTLQQTNAKLMNAVLRNTLEERRLSILSTLQNDFSEIQGIAVGDAKQRLKCIMQRPENSICADCGHNEAHWASTNLGVFLCIDCIGVHRNLGAHISKCRSVILDEWDDDLVDTMESIGNAKSNAKYERALTIPKIDATSSREERTNFIRMKYEQQKFV